MNNKSNSRGAPGRQPEVIELNGLLVNIVRSARRRTLSLEVSHEGVKARAPIRMLARTIKQFVIGKEPWIRHHLANLPAVAEPLRLQDDSELMVLGERYQLSITQGRKPIHLDHRQRIVVPVCRSHLPLTESIRIKLTKWYKQIAMQHLRLRVSNRAKIMLPETVTPTVRVRDYKRRWGSCDHRGDLSFNWRIVMAPEAVLDYVVIHELAHLKEFNHSAKFWRIVTQQMPDWKQQQQWLSDNGSVLYRF